MIKDELMEMVLDSPSDKADAVIEFNIFGIPSAGKLIFCFVSCYSFTTLTLSLFGSVSGLGASVFAD